MDPAYSEATALVLKTFGTVTEDHWAGAQPARAPGAVVVCAGGVPSGCPSKGGGGCGGAGAATWARISQPLESVWPRGSSAAAAEAGRAAQTAAADTYLARALLKGCSR